MAFAVTAAIVLLACSAVYGVRFVFSKRGEPFRDRVEMRWRRRGGRGELERRPIEDVVDDVRRLGVRWHGLHPHTSFAKVEAVRSAYDRALGECCTALGLTHLLGVLPVGPDLDAERERVEGLIGDSGVRLPFAA